MPVIRPNVNARSPAAQSSVQTRRGGKESSLLPRARYPQKCATRSATGTKFTCTLTRARVCVSLSSLVFHLALFRVGTHDGGSTRRWRAMLTCYRKKYKFRQRMERAPRSFFPSDLHFGSFSPLFDTSTCIAHRTRLILQVATRQREGNISRYGGTCFCSLGNISWTSSFTFIDLIFDRPCDTPDSSSKLVLFLIVTMMTIRTRTALLNSSSHDGTRVSLSTHVVHFERLLVFDARFALSLSAYSGVGPGDEKPCQGSSFRFPISRRNASER